MFTGFQSNGPLGSFGANAANTITDSFQAGPGGIQVNNNNNLSIFWTIMSCNYISLPIRRGVLEFLEVRHTICQMGKNWMWHIQMASVMQMEVLAQVKVTQLISLNFQLFKIISFV